MRRAFTANHVITPSTLIHPRATPSTRPRMFLKPLGIRTLLDPLGDHPGQLFLAVPFLIRFPRRRVLGRGHVRGEE